jgi:hypothetical protein
MYQPMAAQPSTMYMPTAAYPAGGSYAPPGYGSMPMQAAYMGGPGGGGAPAQMPGPLPGAMTPDAYGAYGNVPMTYGPQGYGAPPLGPQGYAEQPAYDTQMYGGGPGGPMGGMPGGPMGGMQGGPMGGGMPGGPDGGCPYCGGQGCEACGAGGAGGRHGHHGGGLWPNGLLGDVLGLVAPYPDGGCGAVRWYDVAVDYMMLKRDDTGRNVIFTRQGLGPAAPVALQSNDLDFGSYKPGFRISAALQIGPANSAEFTYFGQFNYNSHARATSANGDLFSVLSNFGTVPPPIGFAETDLSDFQQINYSSQFDSFEINWRNRWVAPNCRYQGSWTLGVRHFILDEKLRYATSSSANGTLTGAGFIPAQARFDTDTTNNLTGLQLGSDLWICLLPGMRVGGELQAGVYGNHMNINTTAGSNLVPDVFRERLTTNDVSFIGQANLLATYRLNYQWSLRAGYQFLFVDGVALAAENFNTAPPQLFFQASNRTPYINDNGNVFYHGWSVGAEFMW